MQQYYDLKNEYSDAILFFRMWDFYEMFDEDAKIAHSILGIALTTRNKNAENPIPLAGIPYHAKEKYLWLLIDAGYKVAIAEQVSDPKLKWIVRREVIRVVTPATLWLESEEYDQKNTSTTIVSLSFWKDSYGMSVLDISTNDFFTSQFDSAESLYWQIYKLNPSEVVVSQELFWDTDLKEVLEKKYRLNIYFYTLKKSPEKTLKDFFWVSDVDSFWIGNKFQAQISAAQLIEYLQSHQKSQLPFIKTLSYQSFSGYMDLDESTIRSLDLVYNLSTNSATVGTLFWILDDTKTSMWKRLLRDQILHPLQDPKEIKQRQEFVQALLDDKKLLDSIQTELKYVSDIDAILNRLSLDRAGVKDMIHLKKSLKAVLDIQEVLQKSKNTRLKNILQ